MKYNILTIADIHFGVMEPEKQYENLELPLIFLEMYKNIDLVVVLGDYFDAILSMNSSAAIYAVSWFSKLLKTAKDNGVKKVRFIRGTKEHDNLQLEAFREMEDEEGFFKLFNENTYEETLPELRAIYCPDENINAKEYNQIYSENMLKFPNIGFFHGSFDVVLPDIVVQLSEETSMNNIIYDYNRWSKIVSGPMISGHWHDGNEIGSLIYVGSFDRWAFNEMSDKGFGFIQMNTETNEYFYKKIVNEFADKFITFDIDTHLYSTLDEYTSLIKTVEKELNEKEVVNKRIRILINITDEKLINETFITSIRQFFVNNKLVKIVIKNKIKKDNEKKKKKENIETMDKYGFIFDKKMDTAETIQKFIMKSKNKDINIDIINDIISKFIT